MLKALPKSGIAELADLLNHCEAEGTWPQHLLHTWYVLLVKAGDTATPGEERPIGLLPMIARAWERVRRPGLADWCHECAGFWDAAVQGSSALRAAMLTMALDETASVTGTVVALVFFDVAKFYDSINLSALVYKAMDAGYPAVDLALVMQLYLAPGRVKANQGFATAGSPSTGIVPGSGQANHLARCMLYAELERVHNKVPRCHLQQFVDDVAVRAEGTSKRVQ